MNFDSANEEVASWNVVTSQWLDALSLDAEPRTCSPQEALEEASRIRCITAASPVDFFAAHRFLLSLLYWKAKAAGGVQAVREALLSGEVPRVLLDAILREAPCFRVFDDEAPFLQDPSVRNAKAKSAGSLFSELACGTNIAHFHHGDDAAMRLCLRCATVGMLRLVPWTQSGGAGLSPAIHNAPPIMALPNGSNLALTLGLNLVQLPGEPGDPRWTGHFAPTNRTTAIPWMEALTWNPRRTHLLAAKTDGPCWRCGRRGVPVVGPIVYAKNVTTTSNRNGTKTTPFKWQDPAAFYGSAEPYVTIKSYDERLAALGRDLASLIDSETLPTSMVLTANPEHHGWRLVIPSTDPANNKTFDHREIELGEISPETIRALLPPEVAPARQHEMDGWTVPRRPPRMGGAFALVRSALKLLTDADWTIISAAAFRQMHESPAAFDLLSGLLWSLRKRKTSGLPSRNAAWLVLKLMATVPSHARVLRDDAWFCPLDKLPKRQLDERRGDRRARSPYPVSPPCGQRLESALREELDRHLRKRAVAPIDWPGLCRRIDYLLD